MEAPSTTPVPEEEDDAQLVCVLCSSSFKLLGDPRARRTNSAILLDAIRYPRSLPEPRGLQMEGTDSLVGQSVFCRGCSKKLLQLRVVLDELARLHEQLVNFQTELAHQLRLSLAEAEDPLAESNDWVRSVRHSILRELNHDLGTRTHTLATPAPPVTRPCVVRLHKLVPPTVAPPEFIHVEIKQEPGLLQAEESEDAQVPPEDDFAGVNAETTENSPSPLNSDPTFEEPRIKRQRAKKPPSITTKSSDRKKVQARNTSDVSEDANQPGSTLNGQPRRRNARRQACQYPHCGYASVNRSHLPAHVRRSHPRSDFLCRRCGAHFPGHAEELEAHERVHTEEEKTAFPCRLCSTSFVTLHKLRVHFGQKHPAEERPTRADFPDAVERPSDVLPGVHECPHCLQEYRNPTTTSWRKHLASHTKPHKCTVEGCGARFSIARYLRFHVIRFHPEVAGHPGYPCPHCPFVTNRPQTLSSHVKSRHETEQTVACSMAGCSFRTPQPSRLKLHMERIHEGRRDFLCTECGKGFYLQNKLNAHMRSHTGERPFACGVCGKRFALSKMLRRHEPIHGSERPFVCELCGARFPTRNNLTGHRHSWHKNGHFRVGVPPTRRSKYDDPPPERIGTDHAHCE